MLQFWRFHKNNRRNYLPSARNPRTGPQEIFRHSEGTRRIAEWSERAFEIVNLSFVVWNLDYFTQPFIYTQRNYFSDTILHDTQHVVIYFDCDQHTTSFKPTTSRIVGHNMAASRNYDVMKCLTWSCPPPGKNLRVSSSSEPPCPCPSPILT
jgi:hypothetical protein